MRNRGPLAALKVSGVVLRLAIVVGAFASIVYGTFLVYPPAAYIVGGGLVWLEVTRAARRE